MAKKKSTSPIDKLKAADKQHDKNVEQYVKIVEALYKKAIDDLSVLATMIKGIPEDKPFSFDAVPGMADKAMEVIEKLCSRMTAVIEKGDRAEWLGACAKSNQFIEDVLKTSKLTKGTLQKYQDRNLEALAAFQERKVDGLGLSERVWKHVAPLKDEVELTMDTTKKYFKNGINSSKTQTKMDRAIGEGMSAQEFSREVRSCLKEPNKLFRRVRDKYGNLHLSKAAKLYHPGQGVYRSSYKNAMRMTRSEINMAYRQSDYMRWQQLDFVVGVKVNLSNNHTEEGRDGKTRIPISDICDCLAGEYPKTFKFIGWHPQCKCFATPIMKSLEEVDKDVDEDGNYTNLPSANQVYDVPQNFKDYVKDNEERMKGWSSTPYYLKDNPQFVDEALHPEKYLKKPLILDADTIKRLSDFDIYGFNHQGSKLFNQALIDAKKAQLEGDLAAFEAAMAEMEARMKKNEASTVSKAEKKLLENIHVLLTAHHDYKNVKYNQKTGGLMATHKDHTFDHDKGQYEKAVQNAGYNGGHFVMLGNEKSKIIGQKFTEGTWDGMYFEVMGCETATKNNYLRGLKHSSSKRTTEVAVLYFPNGGFDNDMIEEAIKRYKGLVRSNPEDFIEFKRVVCVQDGKIVYDQPFKKSTGGSELLQYTPRDAKIEYINKFAKNLMADLTSEDIKTAKLKIAGYNNQQSNGVDKFDKIKAAAEKRHAERTPDKEKQLREFALNHKTATDKLNKDFQEVVNMSNGIKDVDSLLSELKNGHLPSDQKMMLSAEKQNKIIAEIKTKVKEFNDELDKAKVLVKEFTGISDVDAEDILKSDNINDLKGGIAKLLLKKQEIVNNATEIESYFKNIPSVDTKDIDGLIKNSKLADLRNRTNELKNIKEEEQAMVDLIPDVHKLHESYSLTELQNSYMELNGVLSKWLSKYSYSSIDKAPLAHLKNKLDFELRNPTFRYTNKSLIEAVIKENISIIDQKIEWNDIISKVDALKSFKTKSSVYKDKLSHLDDAVSNKDLTEIKKIIAEIEAEQQKILEKRIKRSGDTKSALNQEYKGGAIGTDISDSIDVSSMVSEDPYAGTYTNNIARLQGYDEPAKLVSEEEFNALEKACGEVFYRTVNPTNFKGKNMTSEEFASQLYVADKLELNGPGGRVYGDGMYVAVSAWDGRSINKLTDLRKKHAYDASICYGDGNHTISEMTFTRTPKIIKQVDLNAKWNSLTDDQKAKFGYNKNTYACALGYDAMYTTRDYMVIWNRSIIAVKNK